jgi:hypothetical protein
MNRDMVAVLVQLEEIRTASQKRHLLEYRIEVIERNSVQFMETVEVLLGSFTSDKVNYQAWAATTHTAVEHLLKANPLDANLLEVGLQGSLSG